MNKVVLDGINDNMDFLAQYGAINSVYRTTMGYYVIKYLPEIYILQEDQTICGQVSNADELVVKYEYLSVMKAKKNST